MPLIQIIGVVMLYYTLDLLPGLHPLVHPTTIIPLHLSDLIEAPPTIAQSRVASQDFFLLFRFIRSFFTRHHHYFLLRCLEPRGEDALGLLALRGTEHLCCQKRYFGREEKWESSSD